MYDLNCLGLDIDIDVARLEMFEKYYELLISWNNKMNLTAVTDKEDVYIKHFADSIVLLKYVDLSGKSLIDVGSGAGFPGIPLKIMVPDCKMVLLDSVGKKVSFLNEVIGELGLDDIEAVHGRAEDAARSDCRGKFDLAVSRAVANLCTLSEYCLPFVNNKGIFISYKSGNVDSEISESKNAVALLGGRFDKVEKFSLPGTDYDRSFVFIDKVKDTPGRYPRKAGIPHRQPL